VVEAKWLRQNANRITMPNGVSSYHYQKNCKQGYQKNEALLHGEILEEQALGTVCLLESSFLLESEFRGK
jgi:hypothetical protein